MTDYQVFCDFLSTTYSPDDTPVEYIHQVLNSSELSVVKQENLESSSTIVYRPPKPWWGTVLVKTHKRFHYVSLSGGSLKYFREVGHMDSMYSALAYSPHRVTRLDVAVDFEVYAPPIIQALRDKYPDKCRLLRKSLKTRSMVDMREDGNISGTFFIGTNRSGTRAKVYDKQKEVYDRKSLHIPPTIRYEVVVDKQLGATLRDAALPLPLFCHVACPSLLPIPSNYEKWHPSDPEDLGWVQEMPAYLPASALKRRIETSPEIASLIRLADDVGPEGRRLLVRLLTKRAKQESPTLTKHDNDYEEVSI